MTLSYQIMIAGEESCGEPWVLWLYTWEQILHWQGLSSSRVGRVPCRVRHTVQGLSFPAPEACSLHGWAHPSCQVLSNPLNLLSLPSECMELPCRLRKCQAFVSSCTGRECLRLWDGTLVWATSQEPSTDHKCPSSSSSTALLNSCSLATVPTPAVLKDVSVQKNSCHSSIWPQSSGPCNLLFQYFHSPFIF